MTSVQKVLISYEEFMKLKDLEKRFESVSSELAALKQSEKGNIFCLLLKPRPLLRSSQSSFSMQYSK